MTTNRLTLLVKFRLDVRLERLEGRFITTEELAVHRIMCDVQRERFDVGHVDERERFVLEATRQGTPFLESVSFREVRPEFDGDVEIGFGRRRPRYPRPERDGEHDLRIGTDGLCERGAYLRTIDARFHRWAYAASWEKNSAGGSRSVVSDRPKSVSVDSGGDEIGAGRPHRRAIANADTEAAVTYPIVRPSFRNEDVIPVSPVTHRLPVAARAVDASAYRLGLLVAEDPRRLTQGPLAGTQAVAAAVRVRPSRSSSDRTTAYGRSAPRPRARRDRRPWTGRSRTPGAHPGTGVDRVGRRLGRRAHATVERVSGIGGTRRAERSLESVSNVLDLRCQRRKLLLNGRPDDPQLDRRVPVDQLVAHAGHLRPRHRRIRVTDVLGNVLCGLADHLEVPKHGINGLLVLDKRKDLESDAVGIVPNSKVFDRADDEEIYSLYEAAIEELLASGKTIYVFRHSVEDLDLCRDIKRRFPENDEVKLFKEDFDAPELEHIIDQCDFLIASRYHSIIHAYKHAVPVIAIGWAVKYEELLNEFSQLTYFFEGRAQIGTETFVSAVEKMSEQWNDESEVIRKKLDEVRKNDLFDRLFVDTA